MVLLCDARGIKVTGRVPKSRSAVITWPMSSNWRYYDQDLDRYERELDTLEYESLAKDPYKRKRVITASLP